MRNYVIINGVNSLTIQGLAIKTLPPITKPIQRNLREEIDGRDGDIVTTLGYGAYDKTIEIGLFGTFDIDEVIAYFNQKGTITFSNEADKVYYFEALDQVDYMQLLKFRTANVVLHCQPFKYPLNETPLVEEYEYVEATGTNVTLDNTSEAIFNKIDLQGNTEQTHYTGKNLLEIKNIARTINGITFTPQEDGSILVNGTATANALYPLNVNGTSPNYSIPLEANTTYFISKSGGAAVENILFQVYYNKDGQTLYSTGKLTTSEATTLGAYIRVSNGATITNTKIYCQLEKNSEATSFEPYVGGIPSPNPNYPQDIEVVTGDNYINICGKNLVPFTNQDFTYKGIRYYVQNGSLFLNGTSVGETSSISQEFKDNFSFTLPAGTYYARCGSNGRSYYLYNKTTNTSLFSNPNFVSGGTTRTFTLTEETTLYIGFYVYQNTFNNVNNEIMIGRGNQASTYEPYIGSSYPLYLGVKNLANYQDIPNAPEWTLYPNTKYIELTLKPNTNYTMSSNVPLGSSTLIYFNGTSTATNGVYLNHSSTQTSDSNGKIFFALFTNRDYYNDIINGTYYIQLEEGSKANSYTPYGVTPIEMGSIPNTDYKDLFVKENGTWYKRANVSKVVLDGSESGWFFEGQRYRINNIIQAKPFSTFDYNNPLAYSNYFKWGNGVGSAFVEGAFWYVASGLDLSLQKDQNPNATTLADFKTWLGTHNTIVYYVLATTTDIEITNETLIEQLEAIKNAISYKGQTNITQTNNDMPFVLDLSALKENSDHLVIDNIGNIYSKPTLDLEGTGIVDIYLNDTQMFEVDLTEKNEIVIDTEKMEAYNPTDNTLANRQVTGDYSKFKLDSGENDLRFSGDLTKATITKYIRWL